MVARNKTFTRFAGIRNKESQIRTEDHEQGYIGMRTAINMDIDDNLKIKPAPGFTKVDSASAEDIFYSMELRRCYIIRSGDLYEYFKNGDAILLLSDVGVAGQWEELNGKVYFTNGASFLVIEGGVVREWGIPVPPQFNIDSGPGEMTPGDYMITATYRAEDGRESGALAATIVQSTGGLILTDIPTLADHDTVIYLSGTNGGVMYEALATRESTITMAGMPEQRPPIVTLHLSGPPGGDILTEHQGRMCLGQYFPELNLSAVWRSEPLGFELFDQYSDSVILIPGRVNLIGSVGVYLIIGTDDSIYGYSDEATQEYQQGLTELLEAGSIGGTLAKDVNGELWFWTDRGAAKAMPFQLITDEYFAAPTAVSGSGAIIDYDGFSRYCVMLNEKTALINENEASRRQRERP